MPAPIIYYYDLLTNIDNLAGDSTHACNNAGVIIIDTFHTYGIIKVNSILYSSDEIAVSNLGMLSDAGPNAWFILKQTSTTINVAVQQFELNGKVKALVDCSSLPITTTTTTIAPGPATTTTTTLLFRA